MADIDPAAQAAELVQRLRAQSAELRELDRTLQAQRDANRRAHAREDEEHARAARAGDLGPEWQRVQQRVDLGATSLRAVLSGEDSSPAAGVLRERVGRNVAALRDELDRIEQEDPEAAADLLGEHVRARQALQAALARVENLGR